MKIKLTNNEPFQIDALINNMPKVIDVVSDIEGKQDALVSGTNIKTINNQTLLGSGNIDANEITSITTTESQASGGNNTITITETNGTTTTFNVKNGVDGADGVSLGEIGLVQTTGDATDAVMSQKAVTEYGRKVTAEDLNGTSDWIKSKLTEEGWEINKTLNSNGGLSSTAYTTGYCVSPYLSISDIKGHYLTFCYNYNSGSITNICFYDSNKSFISGLYYTATLKDIRPITIGDSSSWDNVEFVRVCISLNNFSNCYLLDETTGEYILKCDEYIITLTKELNINYGFLENHILEQQLGDSTTKVLSQKVITNEIRYNVSKEQGTGFTLNSNNSYRYIKLTSKSTSLLNASDKMTFMFSTRGTGGNQDYRYFRFGNGSITANNMDATNGIYVGWSYSRNLSANGISYTLNQSGSNYPTPDVWIVTWDRVNGIVRFYDHTTLVNTLSGDSYKKDRFVNDEGKIAILGGDNNTRIYDIRLFDYDISYLFGNSDISSEINNLCGAGILPSQFLNNYNNSDGLFITETNNFQGGGYSATCTYSLDGDDYHIVVKDGVSTTQACGGKPYYIGVDNRAQIEKLDFQVVNGVIKHCWSANQVNQGLNYRLIIDSNGDEITDYDNIGVGSYTLIKTQSTVGARFDFYKVSGDVEVIIKKSVQYKPISCVFHIGGDTMYNKKFYDDQTNSFITLYTDRTCSVEYMEHTLVKTPQRVIRTEISGLNGLPHYVGEMAVVGNNVYIGMADYTWEQINNS